MGSSPTRSFRKVYKEVHKEHWLHKVICVSESQSRYSIVERLTERKLNIIRERSELDEAIKRREIELAEEQQKKLDYKNEVQRQVEAKEEDFNRDIGRANDRLGLAKVQKVKKEAAFAEQLAAIDVALKQIEEVSKSAGAGSQ